MDHPVPVGHVPASRLARISDSFGLRLPTLVKEAGQDFFRDIVRADLPPGPAKFLFTVRFLRPGCSSHGLGDLSHEFNEALDNRALCPVLQGHNGNWPWPDG